MAANLGVRPWGIPTTFNAVQSRTIAVRNPDNFGVAGEFQQFSRIFGGHE
jgi:hypothetical protein